MGNTTPVSVNFSYSDITSQTKKTVNTTNFTSSLTGSLLGDLNISVLGLGLAIPGLGGLVTSIISGGNQFNRSIAGGNVGKSRRRNWTGRCAGIRHSL